MKTTAALLIFLVIVASGNAQNTYPWPASGNIGVGTASPSATLDVNGNLNLGVSGQSIQWAQFSYGSYLDINNSQNALRIRRYIDHGLMAQISDSVSFFQYGDFGIGTSNPVAKLEIEGVLSGGRSDSLALSNAGTASGSSTALYMGYQIAGVGLYGARILQSGSPESTRRGTLAFQVHNDIASNDDSAWISGLFINTDGNLGIGTISPGRKLSVGGASDTYNGLQLTANSVTWYMDNRGAVDTPSNRLSIQNTSGVEALSILYSGNVGIGTTNPTEKLSVNGRIRAKEVIVETTGWSDHVFADSYQLPSLSEVEQSIKTGKHLPGVPSAQEVAEKGVSVGDMQAILLAKIEELTLHQIAQEKKQIAQEQELAAQRSHLDGQAAKIAALEAENARLKAQNQ